MIDMYIYIYHYILIYIYIYIYIIIYIYIYDTICVYYCIVYLYVYIYICTMYGITYANRGLTHSIGSLGCLLHLQTYPMIFPWYSHCCPLNLGELNPCVSWPQDQDSRWPLPRPRTRTFAPVFWKIALESQGQRSTLRHILCVAMWLWFETLNIKRGGKSDEMDVHSI